MGTLGPHIHMRNGDPFVTMGDPFERMDEYKIVHTAVNLY